MSNTSSRQESATSFANLGISDVIVEALAARGINEPFPVQEMTIPDALAGRDVCGKAQTGSGKTLAFGIPMIERTEPARPRYPHALVLVPTRELAQQVNKELSSIAGKRLATLLAVGGVAMDPQIDALQRGADVVVATPGRAVDLLRARRMALFDLKMLVLDEADQMLEAGTPFAPMGANPPSSLMFPACPVSWSP